MDLQTFISAAEGGPVRPSEIAAALGVTTRFIRREIDAGEIPGAYRINRRGDWRVPYQSARAYVLRLTGLANGTR